MIWPILAIVAIVDGVQNPCCRGAEACAGAVMSQTIGGETMCCFVTGSSMSGVTMSNSVCDCGSMEQPCNSGFTTTAAPGSDTSSGTDKKTTCENAGCKFYTEVSFSTCPSGTYEDKEMSDYGYVTNHECCCHDPTQKKSQCEAAGCTFYADTLTSSCPAGTTEDTSLTDDGSFWDYECCCRDSSSGQGFTTFAPAATTAASFTTFAPAATTAATSGGDMDAIIEQMEACNNCVPPEKMAELTACQHETGTKLCDCALPVYWCMKENCLLDESKLPASMKMSADSMKTMVDAMKTTLEAQKCFTTTAAPGPTTAAPDENGQANAAIRKAGIGIFSMIVLASY